MTDQFHVVEARGSSDFVWFHLFKPMNGVPVPSTVTVHSVLDRTCPALLWAFGLVLEFAVRQFELRSLQIVVMADWYRKCPISNKMSGGAAPKQPGSLN